MTIIDPTKAKVIIQIGGAGNKVKRLPEDTRVTAISGGEKSYEGDFVRGRYRGSRITSDPGRFTSDISAKATHISILRQLGRTHCFNNVFIMNGCPDIDFSQFQSAWILIDAGIGTRSSAQDVVNPTLNNPEQRDVVGLDAGFLEEIHPLAHASHSGTVTTAAINDVIALVNEYCPGECGNASEKEFIAVGDPVGPATIPRLYYTADGLETAMTSRVLTGIADGVAVAVTVAGSYVLIACTGTNGGLFRLALKDVRSGGTITPALVNGIAGGTAVNDVRALSEDVILAVGDTGAAWLSDDGGFSFRALTTTSVENLTVIGHGDDPDLVWVGGENGALMRFKRQSVFESIVVTGISTDDVSAIAVPMYRENEVYVGTVAGEIHRSRNAYNGIPTWEEMSMDEPAGGGIIEALEFTGAMGCTLFIIQTNGSSQSRVLVDYSGGALAQNAVAVGTFTSPANSVINAIAPRDPNFAVTVGEPNGGQGFIGLVSG